MVKSFSKDENKIQYVQLPRDLPKNGDEQVFFVSLNDNEQMMWSWHEGANNNFIQKVSWTTPYVSQNEYDLDPNQALASYCAPSALEFLFNSTERERATKEHVAALMKSRYPLSVYILSGGNKEDDETPEQKAISQRREEGLEFLFKDYPSRIFKFRSVDFFKPSQINSSSMMVDKVATVYSAWKEYGAPVLLLHTGHTIWYAAVGADGKILGEGISPGLGIRFQSLHDYCGQDFPMIEINEYTATIKKAVDVDKKPLQMFGTDIKTSMIANISSELYGQLRNIIKQFESKVLHGIDRRDGSALVVKEDVSVVITGRDRSVVKRLLEWGPAIVDVEQGVEAPKTKPSTYRIRKPLWTSGIQLLLSSYINSDKPIDPDDELRDAILGLRVAKASIGRTGVPLQDDVVRGTVVRISKGRKMEDDLYKIIYDDAKETWLEQADFYDGLRLYMEHGEDKMDEETIWAKDKTNKAKVVQDKLETESSKVQKRGQELAKEIEKGKTLVQIVATRTDPEEPPAKKAKKSPSSSKKSNRGGRDPKDFVNMRIVKYFPDMKEWYYGTVDYFSGKDEKGNELWHIQYDDDDQEEFEYIELREGITNYSKRKDNDEKLKNA
mmetsp:Transcript_7535/g.18575  ORF Transcript_7535/g.18575 Transcript_7535/m.18575 type:complete len:610 (-) Transcript_7535:3033-4862(-)